MRRLIALVLVAGCSSEGTSIGNPNKTIILVAPPGDQVELESATLPISAIQVDGEDVEVPEGNDALEGIPIDLPNWLLSVRVELDGTFDLIGTEGASQVDLQLDVGQIQVNATRLPFQPGQPHVFELGSPGWLDADRVGWARGEDHLVTPDSPEHPTLVEAIQFDSQILADPDGDGVPER